MKEELATRYNPADFEQRIYAFWESGGFFTPVVDRDRPKFSIVIPPPNITSLARVIIACLISKGVWAWNQVIICETVVVPADANQASAAACALIAINFSS